MSSNGNDDLNSLPKDIDLNNKCININIKYDDNSFKKELIKVLEEGLQEISEKLYTLGVKIANK